MAAHVRLVVVGWGWVDAGVAVLVVGAVATTSSGVGSGVRSEVGDRSARRTLRARPRSRVEIARIRHGRMRGWVRVQVAGWLGAGGSSMVMVVAAASQ